MKVVLQYEKTIAEVKNEFTQAFPGLKLEFFADAPNQLNKTNLPGNALLGDIQGALKEGSIAFNAGTTVEEVKQAFQNQFRLPVRLYYRAGNETWMEAANHQTLSRQNERVSTASSGQGAVVFNYLLIKRKF